MAYTFFHRRSVTLVLCAWALPLALACAQGKDAKDAKDAKETTEEVKPMAAPAPAKRASGMLSVEGNASEIESRLKAAMKSSDPNSKQFNLLIDKKSSSNAGATGAPPPVNPVDAAQQSVMESRPNGAPVSRTAQDRSQGLVIRTRPSAGARAAPVEHKEIHWSYEGEGSPEHWAEISPDNALCAKGQRQSPIPIQDTDTLQGPAEPIDFHYRASQGMVVNNGHTIEVKVTGDNNITVRGTTYQLIQFHFHHPSEESINGKTYPMVAHLVHRSDSGQLAVVAVLLDTGDANGLIDKVWTYTPLDILDSVRSPPGVIHLGDLLPVDQRYYQFLGSLTTPPCTEGVLWMILKQPMTVSAEQLRLFSQLYPHNARPLQAINTRPIRNAASLSDAPAAAPAAGNMAPTAAPAAH